MSPEPRKAEGNTISAAFVYWGINKDNPQLCPKIQGDTLKFKGNGKGCHGFVHNHIHAAVKKRPCHGEGRSVGLPLQLDRIHR